MTSHCPHLDCPDHGHEIREDCDWGGLGNCPCVGCARRNEPVETDRDPVRIIFLDFDGVLNSERFRDSDRHPKGMHCALGLDPYAVARVYDIVAKSGARIVVTSAWRVGKTVDYLSGLLSSGGCWFDVLDRTCDGESRGEEITEWLSNHRVDSFVILDDEDCFEGYPALHSRLVKTSFEHGLTDEKAIEALIELTRNYGGAP